MDQTVEISQELDVQSKSMNSNESKSSARGRKRMTKTRSFTDALREKYCWQESDNQCEFIIDIVFRGRPRNNGPSCAELAHLRNVVLNNRRVSTGGLPDNGLASLCPNVTDLDLSSNLLESWAELLPLLSQLPHLKFLNLSRNHITRHKEELWRWSTPLPRVENMVLNSTGVPLREVLALARLMPSLRELHLCCNYYRDLGSVELAINDGALSKLECLRLNENIITSWSEVWKLRNLPSLTQLILSENPLCDLFYDLNDPANDLSMFEMDSPDITCHSDGEDSSFGSPRFRYPSGSTRLSSTPISHLAPSPHLSPSKFSTSPDLRPQPSQHTGCGDGSPHKAHDSYDKVSEPASQSPDNRAVVHSLDDSETAAHSSSDGFDQDLNGRIPSQSPDTSAVAGSLNDTETQSFPDSFDKDLNNSFPAESTDRAVARSLDDNATVTQTSAESQTFTLDNPTRVVRELIDDLISHASQRMSVQESCERCQQNTARNVNSSITILDNAETVIEGDENGDENCNPPLFYLENSEEGREDGDAEASRMEERNVPEGCSCDGDAKREEREKSEESGREADRQNSNLQENRDEDTREEHPLPFCRLHTLCVSRTSLCEMEHLHALNDFPRLQSLKIMDIALFPDLRQEDRRKLYVASLPGVKTLNGSEVTSTERDKAERHYLRHFLTHLNKTSRYSQLEAKHGPVEPLRDIDLGARFQKEVTLTFVLNGVKQFSDTISVLQPVAKLRKFIASRLNIPIKSFRMFHFACGPHQDPADRSWDELFLDSLPLSRFDFMDGDELHLEFLNSESASPVLRFSKRAIQF